jgi:hypothetical protein
LDKLPELDQPGDIEDNRDEDDVDEDEFEDEDPDIQFQLPDSLHALQKQLLGDYTLPPHPPASAAPPQALTEPELLSLRHYIAWFKSNGTVQAYNLHAQNLNIASGLPILSLYAVRQLAITVTQLKPSKLDVCPHSCLAYTGVFKGLSSCPYIHPISGYCGQPHYRSKTRTSTRKQPRAQMMYLPVMATIRAMFANAETSRLLRHRDRCLQEALHLVATAPASHKYSDFADSAGLIFVISIFWRF